MIAKNFQKFTKWEEEPDVQYWATQNEENRLRAVSFMVEQYIKWNNLPARMDKTVFEKINKHEEWEEEKKLWDSFTPEEKKLFL